jgi:hypothetical protein
MAMARTRRRRGRRKGTKTGVDDDGYGWKTLV